jgi:hypothetical protein
MIGQSALFLILVAIVELCLLAVAFYSLRRARRSTEGSWESILQRLVQVDRSGIENIALDIIDASGKRRTDDDSFMMESKEIWTLVGGWKGLDALQANCLVLIDLAFYLQQWYPEAFAVTEQLRLSAREIEWQISRLKIAEKTGKLEGTITMYGQHAIATYYLMTRRLLDLYAQLDSPMLPQLQRVL